MILIDSEGSVFSAGCNDDGQLGRTNGDVFKLERINNIPPMLVASCVFYHTLSLDENGGVWTCGFGAYGQLGTNSTSDQIRLTQIHSLAGAAAVIAGGCHSLALSQDSLLIFGWNFNGQLGLGHRTNQSAPARLPFQPALAQASRSRMKSARFTC